MSDVVILVGTDREWWGERTAGSRTVTENGLTWDSVVLGADIGSRSAFDLADAYDDARHATAYLHEAMESVRKAVAKDIDDLFRVPPHLQQQRGFVSPKHDRVKAKATKHTSRGPWRRAP